MIPDESIVFVPFSGSAPAPDTDLFYIINAIGMKVNEISKKFAQIGGRRSVSCDKG